MSFRYNSLYNTDGYKVGHRAMLAEGTSFLYGTWIPRGLSHAPEGVKKIVSFGQRMMTRELIDHFNENFFSISISEVSQFVKDIEDYLGVPYNGDHFRDLHKLGYLPICIKALPEGIETNPNIPHMTFINTVKGYAWLTLYLETIISNMSWKPSTNATIALQFRRNVEEWVKKTDEGNKSIIPFMCHDFSARGLDPWAMTASALAHATSFRGSDSLSVIPAARYYYGETDVAVNSVVASEHSVSTTKIFTVGEKQMIIDWCKIFPTGTLSVVADTFDLWKLLVKYMADPEVKAAVLARDGKLVIRPDSGNPVDIICGTVDPSSRFETESDASDFLVDIEYNQGANFMISDTLYEISYDITEFIRDYGQDQFSQMRTSIYDLLRNGLIKEKELTGNPSEKGVIEILADIYGTTTNSQGYKILDTHVGAIYGDSINLERQVQIYSRLETKGFAATNIILGVGSFAYQFNTRDTFNFAAKGSWFNTIIDNEIKEYNIYKDPKTDDGSKRSLKGRLMVFMNSGEYNVKQECTFEEEKYGELEVIVRDGQFFNQQTLTEIRKNIDKLI